MNAAIVIERLQGGAMDELAALVVDFVLERPVTDLVDPQWVGEQVVVALETATRSTRTEEWLRDRIGQLRDNVPEGTLTDRVPDEINKPLREVLLRPYLADRALVGRLLDHAAFERLMRDVLIGTLHDFTLKIRQLRPTMPAQAARSFGRLKALGAGVRDIGNSLGEGVFGGLSQELETRAEARIREFVDSALGAVVAQVADHACAPEHAADYSAWRAHMFDTVLDTELSVLAGEIDKLDPEGLVATGTAVARSFARRQGFKDEVASVVEVALGATGERSLGDFLRETGLDAGGDAEATWRREMRTMLSDRGRELVATQGFHDWLEQLLAG